MVLRTLEKVQVAALNLRGFKSRHVPTSVGEIHCLDAKGSGDLPTVVVLHGLSSSGADYAPLLRRLRKRHRRVIAPDLPGHGQSSGSMPLLDEPLLRGALVEALGALLRDPAVVCGNSLGGMAATRFALHCPKLVRGLVLVSPGGAPMDPAELADFMAKFQLRTHREALAFMDLVLAKPGYARHVLAFGARQRFQRPGVRAVVEQVGPADLLRPVEVASLTMPTLVIWGAEERILPPSQLEFWRRNLPPHAIIEEPEGYGHAPFMDQPADLARRVSTFTERLLARA